MGYVLKAVLSSAQHPEYGQITVPFPIPDEKYDRMIELLEPLEIGDALRQDCRVDELDSFYTVLNRLVGSLVNFDELDYLAKRLDSFDDGEAAQFQGMACKLGVSNIKDFINLTFCCQQATVITDFSDLDAIGRQHYMTMQGGGCRIEELERLDGRKFALDLILNHLEGRITPYGVVYDKSSKTTRLFFSEVQNKLHWAIHRHTAAELIVERANAEKPHMGLTSWEQYPNGKIQKYDVSIAKNYLSREELQALERIVTMYLDYAEYQAGRHIPMTMQDWSQRLNRFLEFNEHEILHDTGRVTHEIAKAFAESEFEKYRIVQDRMFESDFDHFLALEEQAERKND